MEIIELSTVAMVWISVAVVVASIISSMTGMAGGILMFAAMGTVIPLRPLIAIHGVVQVFGNASRCWFLRRHLLWRMCSPFGVGAVLGAAATTFFIINVVGKVFPLALLCLLIAYSLFKPKNLPELKISDANFFWLGIATGTLGILAGAIDPLLAAFFLRDDLTKEQVVANKSFMQLITHLTKIPAFMYLGFSFFDNLGLIFLFSIAAIVGTRIGINLLNRINTKIFFKLMRLALLVAGLRLSYQLSITLLGI